MGSADRIIRVTLAVVIATLYFLNVISATLAWVLLIVVGVFILTSFIGFCPLYYPFGINTRRELKN